MKKYFSFSITLILLLSLLSTTVQAAPGSDFAFIDLISGQTVIANYGDWLEGTNSTIDIHISNTQPGTGITDGEYAGWCIQDHIFGRLYSEPATLYSSISPDLPDDLLGLPWNEINYVLNHKIRGEGKTDLEFFKDVQTAIWLLLGEPNPEFGISPEAEQMVADAQANADFIPGDGEILAVVVYSDGMNADDSKSVQETIIEVVLHFPKTATPTATLTNTATFTPTETPTHTPTSTGTITETFTPTSTLTDTPTFTPTSTGTITETFTPTVTPTNTFTYTPTSTGTITETFTPTFTPTNTPTFTPTSTGTITETFTPTVTPTIVTEPACTPTVVLTTVTADFTKVSVGASVEGMGKVAPGLNIDGRGTAVRVSTGVNPMVYSAPNDGGQTNGALASGNGFSDYKTKTEEKAHQYTFTFAPGTTVSSFSLRMLDFGDLNPTASANHVASMTAYNAANQQVTVQEMRYTSAATTYPRSSTEYGDLRFSGDAASASPQQPGNWTWTVSGNGITKIVLSFGAGYDPYIGFDTLSFTTTTLVGCDEIVTPTFTPTVTPTFTPTVTPINACTTSVTADFTKVAVGASVEGMGKVAPGLNIDGRGTAVRVSVGVNPMVYSAPNDGGQTNGALASGNGFSDYKMKTDKKAHQYTFTFTPGTTVSSFSLRMLDFGDLNPTASANHVASMTAYNAANQQVTVQEMRYTSAATTYPRSSTEYGDLRFSGDAASASPQQPGNWTWTVSGNGITKIVLSFGAGYDPYIGFDTLTYSVECP